MYGTGAELESEVPVCKSKRLFQITLARVNSGYQGKEEKSGTYNSKVELTKPNRLKHWHKASKMAVNQPFPMQKGAI